MPRDDELATGEPQPGGKQPVELMRELVAGLASSINERLAPPLHADAVGLGIRLEMGTNQVEFDVGYPWDLRVPLVENIVGSTEIMLSQVQGEVAEATAEPWPATAGDRPTNARGLPEPEATVAGRVVELRFRFGSAVIHLSPVRLTHNL